MSMRWTLSGAVSERSVSSPRKYKCIASLAPTALGQSEPLRQPATNGVSVVSDSRVPSLRLEARTRAIPQTVRGERERAKFVVDISGVKCLGNNRDMRESRNGGGTHPFSERGVAPNIHRELHHLSMQMFSRNPRVLPSVTPPKLMIPLEKSTCNSATINQYTQSPDWRPEQLIAQRQTSSLETRFQTPQPPLNYTPNFSNSSHREIPHHIYLPPYTAISSYHSNIHHLDALQDVTRQLSLNHEIPMMGHSQSQNNEESIISTNSGSQQNEIRRQISKLRPDWSCMIQHQKEWCELSLAVYRVGVAMYHSSLVVDGIEWHFWEGYGIEPRRRYLNDDLETLVSIDHLPFVTLVAIDTVMIPPRHIAVLCSELATTQFSRHTYDIIKCNCNHFTGEVLRRLGLHTKMPTWINRLASTADSVCTKLPFVRDWIDTVLNRRSIINRDNPEQASTTMPTVRTTNVKKVKRSLPSTSSQTKGNVAHTKTTSIKRTVHNVDSAVSTVAATPFTTLEELYPITQLDTRRTQLRWLQNDNPQNGI